MPAPDTEALLHLARAKAELDAALVLLSGGGEIVLPAGVSAPADACTHPRERRRETFGGHGYCAACGAKW